MKCRDNRTKAENDAPVAPRDFVFAWQSSSSVAEVSKKTRSTKNAVRVRAHRYREMGVPLKQYLALEFEPIDWDSLAAYAESIEAGQVESFVPFEAVS